MLDPGEVVRLRGSTQDWTIKTARYDEEKMMAFYSFTESTLGTERLEAPSTLITGVVTRG